jgi:hypothetical protein
MENLYKKAAKYLQNKHKNVAYTLPFGAPLNVRRVHEACVVDEHVERPVQRQERLREALDTGEAVQLQLQRQSGTI